MRWLRLVPPVARGLAFALGVVERGLDAAIALRAPPEDTPPETDDERLLRPAFPSQRARAAKLDPYLEYSRSRIAA